ncbi:ChaN family lipoprotein [Vibrio algicola]|uniref:Haem-binding uptake Tiki superfamily ChaN domain-containing protein n=1 Tax=Vibrio algicola TaxID=2662262 RepID=A0A5Q0TBV1_9VIBR|nr:ChaN family lipoprotein [Vibrio algicola]
MIITTKPFNILFGLVSFILLVGCSTSSPVPLSNPAPLASAAKVNTFYDFQLYSKTGQALSVEKMALQAQTADVILVGEWHTHAGIHLFQTQLLQALIQQPRAVALSMEQFSRDKQAVVNEYLEGEIGEQTLIQKGKAWPNYESDYRPLVELAKTNHIDVIAANAPKTMVQCIAKQGLSYLDKQPEQSLAWVAKVINIEDSPYKQKFMDSMHHGSAQQNETQYAAQATWDATIAESMVNYLSQHPSKHIIHIAGMFHTEDGLGTAAAMLRLNPDLNILIITPTESILKDSPDFQLHVLAPPTRFIKKENRLAAYKTLGKRSQELDCDGVN